MVTGICVLQTFFVMGDISREVTIMFRNETKTFFVCEDHVKTEKGLYYLNVELPKSRYQVDTINYEVMGFAMKKVSQNGIGVDVILGGHTPFNRTNTQQFRWVTVNVMRGRMMMTKNTFEYLFNVIPLRERYEDLQYSIRNQELSQETVQGISLYRDPIHDTTFQDTNDVDPSKSPVMSRISNEDPVASHGYPTHLTTYSQRDDSLKYLLKTMNVYPDQNRDHPFLFPGEPDTSFPSFKGVSDIRTSDLENLEF